LKIVEPDDVKVLQFQAPIYFANADIFVKSVIQLSGIDPMKVKQKQEKFNQNDLDIHVSFIGGGNRSTQRKLHRPVASH
jgi:hypothetical protein